MADPPSEMPPHIAETIQAITQLHAEHHRKSTFAERAIDKLIALIARPAFPFSLLLASAAWGGINAWIKTEGGSPPDPPPFAWMSLVLTATALLIAALILTSQRRADKLAYLREQMTLEAALMTEQKTRKIVELLEELRRDSPEIRDRHDAEAAQMAAKADPRVVLEVIEEEAARSTNSGRPDDEGVGSR